MQVAATSSAVRVPCVSTRVTGSRSSLGSIAGLTPVFRTRSSRAAVTVRAEKQQVNSKAALTAYSNHFASNAVSKSRRVLAMLVPHAKHA